MPTEEQKDEMREAMINAVCVFGAGEVIKAVAAACYIASEVETELANHPHAGTLRHYAVTLEELVKGR